MDAANPASRKDLQFPSGSSAQVHCNQARKFFSDKDMDAGEQAVDLMSKEPREDEINESATNDLACNRSAQEGGQISATPFTKFFSIQGEDYGEMPEEKTIDLIKRIGWKSTGIILDASLHVWRVAMRPFLGYCSVALFMFLNRCMVHILSIFYPNYKIDDDYDDNKEDEDYGSDGKGLSEEDHESGDMHTEENSNVHDYGSKEDEDYERDTKGQSEDEDHGSGDMHTKENYDMDDHDNKEDKDCGSDGESLSEDADHESGDMHNKEDEDYGSDAEGLSKDEDHKSGDTHTTENYDIDHYNNEEDEDYGSDGEGSSKHEDHESGDMHTEENHDANEGEDHGSDREGLSKEKDHKSGNTNSEEYEHDESSGSNYRTDYDNSRYEEEVTGETIKHDGAGAMGDVFMEDKEVPAACGSESLEGNEDDPVNCENSQSDMNYNDGRNRKEEAGETTEGDVTEALGDDLNTKDKQLASSVDGASTEGNEDASFNCDNSRSDTDYDNCSSSKEVETGETAKDERSEAMGDELNTKHEKLPRSKDGASLEGNEDDSVQLVPASSCNETSNQTSLTGATKEWFLVDKQEFENAEPADYFHAPDKSVKGWLKILGGLGRSRKYC